MPQNVIHTKVALRGNLKIDCIPFKGFDNKLIDLCKPCKDIDPCYYMLYDSMELSSYDIKQIKDD